jgi:hypothetical protein
MFLPHICNSFAPVRSSILADVTGDFQEASIPREPHCPTGSHPTSTGAQPGPTFLVNTQHPEWLDLAMLAGVPLQGARGRPSAASNTVHACAFRL